MKYLLLIFGVGLTIGLASAFVSGSPSARPDKGASTVKPIKESIGRLALTNYYFAKTISSMNPSSYNFVTFYAGNPWLEVHQNSRAFPSDWSPSNVTVFSKHQPVVTRGSNDTWIIKFKDGSLSSKSDAPIGRLIGNYKKWKGWKVLSDKFNVMAESFNHYDPDLKMMHYHRVVMMSPNGTRLTFMFTYDDSDDGGNTYGWVLDGNGKKVALIEDGDIVRIK